MVVNKFQYSNNDKNQKIQYNNPKQSWIRTRRQVFICLQLNTKQNESLKQTKQ